MTDTASLPKAELHCHSDGLLDPQMLLELQEAGYDPGMTAAELAARYPIESVDSWLDGYAKYVEPHLEPTTHWTPLIMECHVRRLISQNVAYAELFVSKLLSAVSDVGAVVDLFRELRQRIDNAAGTRLRVEFVACVGRSSSEKLARQLPRIQALREADLICGVALAGPEEHPTKPLTRIVAQLHDLGLGIEIHAGEFAGPDSVWDALEHGDPQRIGHGVSAFQDPALIDTLAERNIHLEFCPTSNLRLGIVQRIEEHPLGRAHELGLEFSINTDDPGPFQCSMNSEFELVRETFGFTDSDFRAVYQSALRARFGREHQ
jgi:adenosine deaminase